MKIKYTGPGPGIELPTLGLIVQRNETVDIADVSAKQLLDSKEWSLVTEKEDKK